VGKKEKSTPHKLSIIKVIIVPIILVLILVLVLQSIFFTTPTKAEVGKFLKVDRLFNINSCNPYSTETDKYNEYYCAYYLRRHTTLIFGQIINSGFPLFAYNPFGYFSYDPTPTDPTDFGCALNDSCKNDEHIYILVVTRDEGPLVFNPVNGDYIGKYNDLMQEMDCEVQPYKKPFFPIVPQKLKLESERFKCSSTQLQILLDSLKLNSTDK